MQKVIFLVAPGINNWGSIFGDWRDWPTRFSVWVNTRGASYIRCQAFFYFTTFLTVWLMQRTRARSFSKLIRDYIAAGYKVHLVGHSNGTRVVLDALRMADWPEVETVHLVNGACDADFERNGLNHALTHDRVKKIFCYIADDDKAMKFEDTAVGLMLFGIGWNDVPLGLGGPRNVVPKFQNTRVVEEHWPRYGHSDCWVPANFDATMRQLMRNAGV
jgi:pimeloyl-ACP methyl ester carboxylesterase